jgi:broad specificity phosphatase PhoE
MFTPDAIIDSIQSSKKQFVNTFVTDKTFQTELNKLIDAQAEAAKTSIKASTSIAQAFASQATATMKTFAPAYTK